MILRFAFGFALAVVVTPPSTQAQFVPVISKIRQTDETTLNGKVVKSSVREGSYFRSSDGSTLTQWTKVNGSPASAELTSGGLWDNKTGTSYRLDFKNKRAYVEGEGREPMRPGSLTENEPKSLPHDTVEGVRCTVFPVKIQEPDGKEFSAGQSCTSPEYHLVLRKDLTYPAPSGGTIHSVYEMYDLQLGTEPDAKIFDVSKLFTVYRPTPKEN